MTPIMKPTCGPDDGSNAGPWVQRPATEIDGQHPYAIGKDRDTKQAERAPAREERVM